MLLAIGVLACVMVYILKFFFSAQLYIAACKIKPMYIRTVPLVDMDWWAVHCTWFHQDSYAMFISNKLVTVL